MYVHKVIYILRLLAVLCSFTSVGVQASFLESTHKRWISTFKIKVNPHFTAGVPIKNPKGTIQPVMEIFYFDRDFKIHKDCLLYYVPGEKSDGELKVVPASLNEVCREKVLEPSKISIKNIFNFGFKLKKFSLTLLIDTKAFNYNLYNLRNEEPYVLYDNSKTKNKFPGLFISFEKKKNGHELVDGDKCFDVGDKCEVTQKNICNLCPGSVTEVINDRCPGTYTRYCKNTTCGAKAQVACIRGVKASSYRGPVCIPGSPIGFCQKPYKVFCENGELICR